MADDTLAISYLGGFPQLNRVIFFSVLDKWQSAFILEEAKKANVPTYGSIQSTVGSLSSLSTPVTQLLFAEPSLLDNADIATFIDASIDLNPSLSLANVAALGATPLLIHLLCSPQENRRVWAKCQLPAAARRRLSFQSFVETGVRDEVQSLYEGGGYIEAPMRWDGLRALLDSGCLGQDAVERGLLAGEDVTGKKQGVSGIMGVLSGLLGAQSICKFLNIAIMRLTLFQTFQRYSTSSPNFYTILQHGHSGLSTFHQNSLTPCSLRSRTTLRL